jgi:hypothetical protein
MAGLAYAQQQRVIAHTGFSQQAVRILSIIGKLLYSMLGIVVIPGRAIVVDESEQHSASMVCRVCGINLRTLRRRSSSNASPRRSATPAPDFFPISLTLSQPDVSSSPPQAQPDCRLLLERPDGAKLSIFLPSLTDASIHALCSSFLHS